MEHIRFSAAGRRVEAFAPADPAGCPVVYTHFSEDEGAAAAALLEGVPVVLVSAEVDWNNDLSPWPAPRAYRGGAAFGGGAPAYLRQLTGEILPRAEAELGLVPPWRGIAGYSMAGLFALYALFAADLFSRAASMSGSLWYDGFAEYLEGRRPPRLPGRVYLSLGEKESLSRSPRLAAVGSCTRRAAALFEGWGVDCRFESSPGGHFDDVARRTAAGIGWIARP